MFELVQNTWYHQTFDFVEVCVVGQCTSHQTSYRQCFYYALGSRNTSGRGDSIKRHSGQAYAPAKTVATQPGFNPR